MPNERACFSSSLKFWVCVVLLASIAWYIFVLQKRIESGQAQMKNLEKRSYYYYLLAVSAFSETFTFSRAEVTDPAL